MTHASSAQVTSHRSRVVVMSYVNKSGIKTIPSLRVTLPRVTQGRSPVIAIVHGEISRSHHICLILDVVPMFSTSAYRHQRTTKASQVSSYLAWSCAPILRT